MIPEIQTTNINRQKQILKRLEEKHRMKRKTVLTIILQSQVNVKRTETSHYKNVILR